MRKFLTRLGRFTLLRAFWLFLALAVAVFLTVVIANMGGEMDRVKRAEIKQYIGMAVFQNPANKGVSKTCWRHR